MRAILKIYRKGIIVLPKSIRQTIGVDEGDSLIAEVKDSAIVLTPLIPKRVKLGGRVSEIVRATKREEVELET